MGARAFASQAEAKRFAAQTKAARKLTAAQRAQFAQDHFDRLAIINRPFPEAQRRQSAMPWAGTIVKDDMLLKIQEQAQRIKDGGMVTNYDMTPDAIFGGWDDTDES